MSILNRAWSPERRLEGGAELSVFRSGGIESASEPIRNQRDIAKGRRRTAGKVAARPVDLKVGVGSRPSFVTTPGGIDMKVWIQHADFSEDEFDLGLDSTWGKFNDVDWPAELALEEELVKRGDESCPPGLGIVGAEGRILHICPNPAGALVHFHYPHKALGFVKTQKSMTLEDVRPAQIEHFIHAFFDQEWDVIMGHA